MKIIQANKFYYLRSGAARYMLELSNWLESEGNEVIPFAMQHPKNLTSKYQGYFPSFVQTQDVNLGLGAVKTLGRMMYSLEARRNMSDLISDVHPNICHLHNVYSQLSPSILRPLHNNKIPVVMTVHDHHLISPQYNIWAEGCGKDYRNVGVIKGTLSRFHKRSYAASFAQVFTYKLHRAFRFYERYVDMFLLPSEYMKRQLLVGGFPEEKMQVIRYGIDLDDRKPHYEHDDYALYVGRLSEEKGIDTVLSLAKVLPDIQFKIVGSGPDADRLHKLAHGLDNVELLGFRSGDALQELYDNATVVLIPSRVHENFPLITLEAMAAGKPIVASNVGGIPEIVEDHITGFLVHPLDIQAWTEALMRAFYDDHMQETMSRNARAVVEKDFSLDVNHNRMRSIYESLVR